MGSDARSCWLQSRCLQEGDHFGIEDRVANEDGIPIRTRLGEGLAQLLNDPLRSWVAGHVPVQNPAPSMLNAEKAVEQSERHRGHREKVEGGDHLAMIL
jgi:hypothetical protein